MFRMHLGWLQLKKEKLRSAVAVAGVCFAVGLILMQLGFQAALFASSVRYHEAMQYDIALVSPETSYIAEPRPFPERRLQQTRGHEGVEDVAAVYAQPALWKNPWTSQTRRIFAIGFDPVDRVFEPGALGGDLRSIRLRDAVLFDSASRPEYGPVAEHHRRGEPVAVEVNNRSIRVAGLFRMGTSFGIDGAIVTSDMNFLRLFPARQRGLIDLGLIRLTPGADPAEVRDQLRRRLPGDVLVLTKADYILREQEYWAASTPIGYVFGFGVIIGLVVGSIIVYQILFSDVSDHLAEYATLKAMGYSNRALSGVVIEQAIILAVMGFVPGVLLCIWLYHTVGAATLLPMGMTGTRLAGVLGLTILMCCISGVMALRKVRSADPAEVF